MITRSVGLSLSVALIATVSRLDAQVWQKIAGGYPADATPAGVGPIPSAGQSAFFAGTGNNLGDFRSTDGGLSWTATGAQIFDSSNRVITAHTFFRASSGRLFRGGPTASWDNRVGSPLWYSDNNGTSWTEVPFPFSEPASNFGGALSFSAMAEAGGALFGADELSDGVWKSTDNGLTWAKARIGLPAQPFINPPIVINSGLAASGNTLIVANPLYGLYRSTDGGANWVLSVEGIPGTPSVVGTQRSARDVVVTSNGTFYAGVDNGIWRSTDDGVSWALLSSGLSLGNMASLAADGTKFYAYTTSNTLLESTDGGESFAVVAGGTPPPYRGSNYRQLVVRDGNALYSADDGVYRLDVNAAARTPILPVILAQPVGGGVNVGTPFTFTVGVNRATAPLTYTWKRGTTTMATTSAPSFTLASATVDDAGSWSVTITNAAGAADSVAVDLIVAPFAPGQIDYTMQPLALPNVAALGANAVAMGRDGEIFVGGSWVPTFSLTPPTRRLARLRPDGRLDTEFFADNNTMDGVAAFALFPLADGSVLVGGGSATNQSPQYLRKVNRFGQIEPAFVWPAALNGTTFAFLESLPGTALVAGAHGVHRIFTDLGYQDPSFTPPVFVSNNFRTVRSLSALPDGRFYAGGQFTAVNGLDWRRIARFLPNGTVDVTFVPQGTGVNIGFNDEVLAVAAQTDGKVIVAGSFTTYAGLAVPSVVRLNADGSRDSSFEPGAIAGTVRAVAIGLDGAIYVGGNFTTIGGITVNGLARLNSSTGAVDTTFAARPSVDAINALTVQADGRLLVASAATAYRVLTPEVATPRIARFSRDLEPLAGEAVTLSVTLAGNVAGATFQWYKDDALLGGKTAATLPIASFSAADAGTYHVTATIGSTVLTSPTARLDLRGLPEFRIPPVDTAIYPGTPGTLIASVRGAGNLTYQWFRNGSPVNGATNTFLYFAAPAAADAGTYFLRATGSLGSTDSDSVYLSVVPRPASVDTTYRVTTATTSTFWESMCALELPDGTFLVGGRFNFTGGVSYNLLQTNAAGSVIRYFDGGTYGFAAAVRWLGRQPDGKIIVGDASSPKRLLPNLDLDSTFTPPYLGNNSENVTALLVLPDGKILLSVHTETIQGYTRLVRLNSNGTVDTTFPALNPNSTVQAIHRESDGALLLGGSFGTIAGQPRAKLARILPNGQVDPNFVPPSITPAVGGASDYSFVTRGPDGTIYAGGNFKRVGATPANGLARFGADGQPDPTFYLSTGNTYQVRDLMLLSGDRLLAITAGNTFAGDIFHHSGARDIDSSGIVTGFGGAGGAHLLPLGGPRVMVSGLFSIGSDPVRLAPVIIFTDPVGLYIQAAPAPAVVDLNGSTTFTVGALGTTALSYQWLFNGEEIAGATGASYTVNPVLRASEGHYSVRVTNAAGTLTSAAAFLDVRAEPEIVTAPQGTTRAVGSNLTLTVQAVGAGTLSYRWLRNGEDLADGAPYSGTGTASLTLTNAQEIHSGLYSVRVTNSLGNVTSATAQVNIILQPGTRDAGWSPAAINNGVQQVIVRADGSIFITSRSTSGFTTVGGQSRPAVALLNANGSLNTTFESNQTVQSGFTTRRFVLGDDGLTLYAAFTNGSTSYILRYGADGKATLLHTVSTGAVYDLVVESPSRITYVGSFTKRVERITVNGDTASVDDTLVPPTFGGGIAFSIARRAGGGYVVAGSFAFVNSTAYSHVIKIADNGTLDPSFHPTNAATISSWIYLRELADGKVIYGGRRYTTTGALDPTWLAYFIPNNWPTTVSDMTMTLDGKLIVVGSFTTVGGISRPGIVRLLDDGNVDPDFTPGTGASSGNLFGIGLGANGTLYGGGSLTAYNSQTVARLVRINHEPTDIAFLSHPAAIAVNLDAAAVFSVTTYGSSTISYRWLRNGVPLAEGGRITGTTSATLTVSPVARDDAGDYRVEITNLAGTRLSNLAALTVLAEPVLLSSPTGGTQSIGSNVTLVAAFSGAAPLTYSWTRDGDPVTDGGRFSGATTASLVITGIQLEDAGSYVATATNSLGDLSTDPAQITVIIPPASLDASLPASLGANNTVTGLVPLPDGRFLVGGAFTAIGGQSRSYLAVLDANGAADPTFTPPTMVGNVTRVWALQNGGFLIGGNFTTVNGNTTAYRNLYRLTPELTLDTTFSAGLNGVPNSFLEESTGTYLIGGGFSTAGGASTHPYFARLNATTGALDTSLRVKVNANVQSMARDSSGRIYLGGLFTQSGTDTTSGGPAYLARMLSNGTLDTWTGGLNSNVYAVALDSQGRLLVGGQFTTVSAGAVTRNYLARFLGNGSVDPDFNPAPNNIVRSIAIQDNGSILLSGTFTTVASTASARLARITPAGTIDPNFAIGTGLGTTTTHFSDPIVLEPNGRIWLMGPFTVYKGTPVTYLVRLNGDPVNLTLTRELPALIVVQPGAPIDLVSGATGTSQITYAWTRNASPVTDGARISGATTDSLRIVNSVAADSGYYQLTVTNASGFRQTRVAQVIVLDAPVITVPPEPASVATNTNLTLTVEALGVGTLGYQWYHGALALTDGGRVSGATTATLTITGIQMADAGSYSVVVTNTLGAAMSEPVMVNVFIPPAGIDGSFDPVNVTNNIVQAIAVETSGDLLIGGAFTAVRGVSHTRLARLLADGSRDSTFAPAPNSNASRITALPDGNVMVSGAFTSIAGTSQSYLARLLASGARDTTFTPPALGTGVISHYVQPDGKVVVAGSFSTVSGQSRPGFARLNVDGSLDDSFVPTGTSGIGYAIHPLPDGGFLFGFNQSPFLVRVGADGTKDTSFTLAANSTVERFLPRADGGVVVIGGFSQFAGASRSYLAALGPNLSHDPAWGATLSFNASISAAAVQPNGRILLGGAFTGNLRRLLADGTLDPSFTPGAFSSGSSISAIAVSPLGPIWLGGSFSTYNGQSTGYLVRLNGDPVDLLIQEPPTDQAADLGANATFTVAATGTSTVNFRWRKNGVNLQDDGRLTGTATATLTITGVVKDDAGVYDVIVSNLSGEHLSASATLTVRAEPVLLASPVSRVVSQGSPLVLSATFSGAATLTYAWTFQGEPLADASGPTLDLGTADAAESGLYVVTATNSLGEAASEPVAISVAIPEAALSFTAQPADVEADAGDRVVLRAAAVGGSGLGFQWLKGGNTLAGRTGPELVLDAVTATDAGAYSVVIFAGSDTLASQVATVTVGGNSTTTFASWIASFGVTGGLAGPLDDADGDGVRNLAAFAYGMAPVGGDRSRLPSSLTVVIDSQSYLQFSYVRRTDAPSLAYTVRAATTLTGLSSPNLVTAPVGSPVPLDATTERITVRLTTPLSGLPGAFLDLQIADTPNP